MNQPYSKSNPLPDNALKDKVILITGVTSGIGRSLSLSAASLGATVILLGKDVKKLEKLYDEIIEQGFPEPAIHPLNLLKLDPDKANDLKNAIQKLYGRLDGIVHNAAEINRLAAIEHYPAWLWQSIMHVNLNTPFLLTQTLMELLKKSSNASIVFPLDNFSINNAYWGAYGCAKAGLKSLSEMLISEFDNTPNIRVNNINLHKVNTKLRRRVYPAEDMESLLLPEDTVYPFLYLLSDLSKEVHGQTYSLSPEEIELCA